MRKTCVLTVVFILGGSISCKSAPETADSPPGAAEQSSTDRAKFRFGWKSDWQLRAEVRKEFRRPGGKSTTIRTGYRLDTERSEQGFRVDISPTSESGATEGGQVTVEDAIATASYVALPTFEVTSEGAFDSAEKLESTREEFQKVVRSLMGGSLEKGAERALEPMLADDYLSSRARQYWSLLVGTWAGSKIEVGNTQQVQVSDSFQFPVVGQREVQLDLECTVEERLPCSSRPAAEGSDAKCVRLTMQSRPDVQKMKEVLQRHVDEITERKARDRGMEKVPDLTVENVFVRSNLTLITEPATLRPHRWSDKKTVRMTLSGPNGEERSYKLVDKTRTVFSAGKEG